MTTALLVIDVQQSFAAQPAWADIHPADIVERAARLVRAARAAGDLVVWVIHEDPGSGGPFDPAGGLCELQPGLEALDGEPVIRKTSHNAFTTTDLARRLTEAGVTRVRVAGIRTEQCVETTTRLASDLGYDVELVLDATATHPLALHDGSGTLPAAQVVARTAAALAGRFATIRTLDDVVAG